jgi:phosphopantothenoylcysteine decarboxylase/phosphopantothenate--cysteine ligase
MTLDGKSVLLIITGGIAAYKSLELIRLMRSNGGTVRCVLTKGGAQFVTPLSVSALSENEVYQDLWSLKDESEMGHIRLTREADIIVIAPCSANMMAKLAHGLADDLASTTMLANDKPVLLAPAMNHKMWDNAATQDNLKTLQSRGFHIIGPESGAMACNESGIGRMSEPAEIFARISEILSVSTQDNKPLSGFRALVTSGPTFEPIDPVRFLGNRSSGKQGHAIASALAHAGADVTLISGPVNIQAPAGVTVINAQTAVEMLDAARKSLPVDIAVCAAAVSDWSAAATFKNKIKKNGGKNPPDLKLKENPDILATLARPSPSRPEIVVGFAAETENIIENARLKLAAKSCDLVLANDVSDNRVFGKDTSHIHFITEQSALDLGLLSKQEIAQKLVADIITRLEQKRRDHHIDHAAE